MDTPAAGDTGQTIQPDGKDWTWVLEQQCPECGFDTREVGVSAVPALVRSQALAWQEVLERPGVAVRPDPGRWSALEYACHVRDVFRRFDTRLHLMLDHDDPLFDNWDQDATAVADRYGEQSPRQVATELALAAETVAASFEAVRAQDLGRVGRRSDGAHFTVETFGRYFIHDPVHHLHDVAAAPAPAGAPDSGFDDHGDDERAAAQ